MITFPYNTQYEPAVPVCEITLINTDLGQQVLLSGVVDTGADATLVPVYLFSVYRRTPICGGNIRFAPHIWGCQV
jgi:hypothetical protein